MDLTATDDSAADDQPTNAPAGEAEADSGMVDDVKADQ